MPVMTRLGNQVVGWRVAGTVVCTVADAEYFGDAFGAATGEGLATALSGRLRPLLTQAAGDALGELCCSLSTPEEVLAATDRLASSVAAKAGVTLAPLGLAVASVAIERFETELATRA